MPGRETAEMARKDHAPTPCPVAHGLRGRVLLPAPMSAPISTTDRHAYYRAALRGLRFVEHRAPSGRRFGADADALWKGFAGRLDASDRIDLLLRDADTEWPGAFGARATFGLRATAEDEAFGAEWESLDGHAAAKLWAEIGTAAPADVTAVLREVGQAWALSTAPFEVAGLDPTLRIAVSGASAIVAAILAFAAGSDLAWSRQVTVVSDRPAERQLGALAAALLDTGSGTTIVSATEPEARALRFGRALVSGDADEAARSFIAARVG